MDVEAWAGNCPCSTKIKMKTTKQESTDLYIALFMMLMAIVNIVLIIVKANQLFLRPFSIGLSVFIFYFAWKQVAELETYKKLKMLFFLHHLEKEAQKEAKKVIENVVKESTD